MECNGCGSKVARHIKVYHTETEDKRTVRVEECNECRDIPNAPGKFRDAAGNVISWNEVHPRFSYATGTVIQSKKDFSETLKKMDLVQTGGERNLGKRKNEPS